MIKSPVHPKFEKTEKACYEFDPHANFSQFLEEAKHAKDINLQRSSSCSEEVGKKGFGGRQKKSKKFWKNSVFFFTRWKTDKNCKTSISKPTKGNASSSSGPLWSGSTTTTASTAGKVDSPLASHRLRHISSGPISILFNPTRKMETEVPYMCLDQVNDPYQINAYGPVYSVT